MTKMLDGIRKKLAYLLHPVDVAGLTRAKLNRTDFRSPQFDDLPESEKAEFMARIDSVACNREFMALLRNLEDAQVEFMAKSASSARELDFCRATINGVSLVREEVERVSSLHREATKQKEKFDAEDLFN